MPDTAVRTLRLVREAQRNALDGATIGRLRSELAAAESDPEVRCVVIAAAGPHFCAGADIREYRGDPVSVEQFGGAARELLAAIGSSPLPVIASVRGAALGGGFELALACDLVIASETARFGLPELALGLLPGWGGTQRLPQYVGQARARELIWTGRRLTAAEGFAAGFVAEAVEDGELERVTASWAEGFATRPRAAVAAVKRAVGATGATGTGLALEAELLGVLLRDADGEEGVMAFLEKRPPRFGQKRATS
jgi:enoyl-CoA hydratase